MLPAGDFFGKQGQNWHISAVLRYLVILMHFYFHSVPPIQGQTLLGGEYYTWGQRCRPYAAVANNLWNIIKFGSMTYNLDWSKQALIRKSLCTSFEMSTSCSHTQ